MATQWDSAVPEVAFEQVCAHGEGVLWSAPLQELVWVDLLVGRIHRVGAAGARVHETGAPLGALAPRARGGFVCAVEDGFALLDESGKLTKLGNPLFDRHQLRMNDGACDAAGRFWAGSMANDEEPGAAALYRLDSDETVTTVLTGVTVSNGIGWSADGHICYYIDTGTGALARFDFDMTEGRLSNRRVVAVIDAHDGVPDGLTVDADGAIWVAVWRGGEVRRYAPDGRLDRVVRLPVTQVSSCAFGGRALDTLYITTSQLELTEAQLVAQPHAGKVFAIRPGVTGFAAEEFAG